MRHRASMLATAAASLLLAGGALAEDQPAAAAAPPSWLKSIKVTGHVDFGGAINPAGPDSKLNFGHLFDDRANQFLFNQGVLTIERDPDPKSKTIDLGFKVQAMYGSDSRFTHFIGELDRVTASRNQIDIVEANVQAHLPVLTVGGVDVKAGQFVTLEGAETIDPTSNFFYSHTYLFNFGIPFKHTGILVTTHVNPTLDLILGYTTGVNASFGRAGGVQANQPHFHGGIGLNLKNLTLLATTHIGPELPNGALGEGVSTHGELRYLNDILLTWKINGKLTSITDINYIRDDGVNATGGGVAQYFAYSLNSELTLGLRGEVWRDNNGFYVAAFPGNLDFINAETGRPNGSYGGGNTTYGAITAGVNIKPQHLPKAIDGLTIRPEIRYDRALAGGTPFGGNPGTAKGQFTFGIDLVAPLTF